jgi:hypothetical protein
MTSRSNSSGSCEEGANNISRVLSDEQLILLRDAIKGGIFDTEDGSGLKSIELLVKAATGVSPQIFNCLVEGFRHRPNNGSGSGGDNRLDR